MANFEQYKKKNPESSEKNRHELIAKLRLAMANTVFKTPFSKFASEEAKNSFIEALNPNPN